MADISSGAYFFSSPMNSTTIVSFSAGPSMILKGQDSMTFCTCGSWNLLPIKSLTSYQKKLKVLVIKYRQRNIRKLKLAENSVSRIPRDEVFRGLSYYKLWIIDSYKGRSYPVSLFIWYDLYPIFLVHQTPAHEYVVPRSIPMAAPLTLSNMFEPKMKSHKQKSR